MGCLKLDILERSVSSDTSELKQEYQEPELKIVYSVKRLSSEKSSSAARSDYGARWYDPATARWSSVDPLAESYSSISPYTYVANNPVKYIDPDGKRFINFDANGNYTGTTKDNWWHNLWFGSRGLITNSDGSTRMFKFADPKNDVLDIQLGVITQLITVGENQIKSMLIQAGAFNNNNRKYPATFLNSAGVGNGAFDFSFSHIPDEFGISEPVLDINGKFKSPYIFLTDGVAHNYMNFGNFMFGAGGATLGVHLAALKLGAHKNSRFPEDEQGNRIPPGSPNLNNYRPQWDSSDDQFSIKEGYYYARGGGLLNRWFGNGRAWDKKILKGSIQVGPLQQQ